ncbi:membrane protein FxsA [Mycobacterium sp. 663a-19]|uniref:FxsA family protein n=1 Tax=Mycobacterium sp. 663a-19 TaxID=2986148 RepID=UPI002D1EB3E3|nr:FxsA family protein [Mycobacterium sp. 663a-19]MEB3981647.1 membrane protein FxsA [Mycobacterium sp. 663a-19]
MLSRLLLVYAVVELAVIFALVSTIGWGWTLLVLLATFLLGWGLLAPMAGSQLIRQLGQLRSGLAEPQSAVNDGAMVGLAMALVLIPGLVTSALGLLLLMPPIRTLAGPGLAGIALRGLQRRVPLITERVTFTADSGYAGDGRDYIDGEVIDVTDVEPPPRPPLSPGPI